MDLSEDVKASILTRLDATGGVTSVVPSSRIFPMKVAAVPEFPFIRYDPPDVVPYENSCGAGVEVGVRLSLFIKSEAVGQAVSASIVESLTAMSGFQQIDWVRTQVLPEEEADVFHYVMDFNVIHTQ